MATRTKGQKLKIEEPVVDTRARASTARVGHTLSAVSGSGGIVDQPAQVLKVGVDRAATAAGGDRGAVAFLDVHDVRLVP